MFLVYKYNWVMYLVLNSAYHADWCPNYVYNDMCIVALQKSKIAVYCK